MGRAGKWLRSLLTGKKERDREKKDDGDKSGVLAGAPPAAEDKPAPTVTPPPPKEKRRWSFRRSVGGGRDLNSPETTANAPVRHAGQDPETEQMRHAVAAAAGAAVAAAQAAAAVIRLTAASAPGRSGAVEEDAAAVKIQSIFRAYLARKALRALKGLVKLQALVRGHLVRKQATATLRCMQALVTAQARARAQRIRMAEDAPAATPLQRQPTHRRSPLDPRHRSQPYDQMDGDLEDDIKIVEMDLGESKGSTKSRSSYSITHADRSDHRLSSASYYGAAPRAHSIPDLHLPAATSPSPSALTDMSPRACSGHFEEFSFPTAQSTPHYHSSAAVSKLVAGKPPPGAPRQEEHGYCSPMSNDHPLFPNYMANTESSKAKSRSQSAPKQRPEITCERPPSRRRPSVEGRGVPRGSVRMQRSSSHVGCSATNGYQYPWSLKLDRSSVSLKDSECGSTSTALTNTIYCKSLVSYEIYGNRY